MLGNISLFCDTTREVKSLVEGSRKDFEKSFQELNRW